MRTIEFLFLMLMGMSLMDMTPAAVSHEDIQGTLQSLIYSYNLLDNKLERHEHRERSLGELLKKSLLSLQKGQKNLEPISGIFSRLDERVSQIETMLITQEEKYNIQTEKLGEALEHIYKWMRETNACKHDTAVSTAGDNAGASNELIEKQTAINFEIAKNIKSLSERVGQLQDTAQKLMDLSTKILPTANEKLNKIETQLSTAPSKAISEPIKNVEFENKVLQKFDDLRTAVMTLQNGAAGLTTGDKEFIHSLNNETLNAMEHLKVGILTATDKALTQTTQGIQDTQQSIEGGIEKLNLKVADSADVLNTLHTEVNSSYTKFNDGLDVLNKFNNILLVNSDYVLDTQRKVEFGTLQVVQKIGDLLDKQRQEVGKLMKEQIDESILSAQIETVQNFSSIIETEISQVWRQVAIMTGEMSDTKELLNIFNVKNDIYTNETSNSVTTMSTKVEDIKGRMLDMDANLNFLLGKLSLMAQEFGNIKIGLANSLEEIRNTFHSVQTKLPAQGPGPHTIPKNAYETELNLLNKRHTTA